MRSGLAARATARRHLEAVRGAPGAGGDDGSVKVRRLETEHLATLTRRIFDQLAGGGAAARAVGGEQHANAQAPQAPGKAQRAQHGERHDDPALALRHARPVDAVPFDAVTHRRLVGGGIQMCEEEQIVGVAIVVLPVANVRDIDARDIAAGEADLAELAGEPRAQPFDRFHLVGGSVHVHEPLECVLGRRRLTAQVRPNPCRGALVNSVDEQRFCQCKRAATLSVPPSPSEDGAAPVWRPGTPLART